MASTTARPAPLTRLADGTVKQISPFTGTEVWTVPGRANRPIAHPITEVHPLTSADRTCSCAFCSDNYLQTPPEKSRLIQADDGTWHTLDHVGAGYLFDTTAQFRRVPNLFEILSYDYWHTNYGLKISQPAQAWRDEYLADPAGRQHVMDILHTKLRASGASESDWKSLPEGQRHSLMAGFFAGGHDVIIGRRHYTDDAVDTTGLASSGTLTPDEHRAFTRFTVAAAQDLYTANPHAKYVAVFQNWLRPSGASFDHLHKQLVAIDEYPVSAQRELAALAENPHLYQEMALDYASAQGLVVAHNEHAVAFAGFGHRYPTLEVYSLSTAGEPWLMDTAEVDAMSDLIHALHAATGADVPCNEEWHYKPIDVAAAMPWHVTLKWRINNPAGFEGGTKIYLNTIDPWTLHERVVTRLGELQSTGRISASVRL